MGRIGHWYDMSGGSRWRIFAPERHSVALVLLPEERVVPMAPDTLGYWHLAVERLQPGQRYWIAVDDRRYPDVTSRRQPDGVHGSSMLVEDPVAAQSGGWMGVKLADAIVYELHLGTFTAEGTLHAAMDRLAHLAETGMTVVELMPIAAFPGTRNWGYDGVCLFALHADYGSYDDLRQFIECAHGHGMAVLLDVVYNHFGPEGNYSAAYAPYTRQAATPWGAAINFDAAWNHGVREFFLENARYWLQDIGFDGFRMDAVHAVFDSMPVHILREITDLTKTIAAAENREILMIAEHLHNDRHVTSSAGFGFGSQWNDDVAHAVGAYLGGERHGHLANFGDFADVVKALADGFVLDGSRFDRYRRFMTGTDARDTRGVEHIVHVQNHDQIGNRLNGDRMIATHGRAKALLAATAMLATAFVPMLFMGEEFGATTPFHFFEDFGDAQLIDGVREGRRRELGASGDGPPPDPHALSTYLASRLRWSELDAAEGQAVLAYYRQLIACKRAGEFGPRDRRRVTVSGDEQSRLVRIQTPDTLTLLNFSAESRPLGPLLQESPQESSGSARSAGAWRALIRSMPFDDADEPLPAFGAIVLRRAATPTSAFGQARPLPE